MKPRIQLVALSASPDAVHDAIANVDSNNWTLRQLFENISVRTVELVEPAALDRPAKGFVLELVSAPNGGPLHDPLNPAPATELLPAADLSRYPESLDESAPVQLAYTREVRKVASFLRAELSVLVYCDKVVVAHLWPQMVRQAVRKAVPLIVPDAEGGLMGPAPYRQRQLAELKKQIEQLKVGNVLVIPHLDLLAGDTGENLSPEARELTEIVFGATGTGRLMLAFADRSLVIPEVLANRFAARCVIEGLHREVERGDGRTEILGQALVTRDEARRFSGYVPDDLFKNVAGMNPVHLRNAFKYAMQETDGKQGVTAQDLYTAIRTFKTNTSTRFELPDVTFDQIGGYEDVKNTLRRVLLLLTGSYQHLPEKLQREMIPRGFIFYGPPGTGKTLFAKAIAHELKATIQVVSGPEITDKYVGESERKLRELFGEARRNAPAVLVFDEFDSIAAKRSGRDDGGSRAGNAVVAQILTEMDGFRPDVPMLVIGTTNRLELIDDALLRPSRFQAIKVDLPNEAARRRIAEVHANHFLQKDGYDPALLNLVAANTEGFNGDDIRSIFRDACVGLHCEGKPVDARRIGFLVGQLRRIKQQQSLERTQSKPPTNQPGQRHALLGAPAANTTSSPSGPRQPLGAPPANAPSVATTVQVPQNSTPPAGGPA
jgi:transitional endoplasmic reticulum ATPase